MIERNSRIFERFFPKPPPVDLTVFGFIFVLIVFLVPLDDPDFYWHLKTGEYLFATHSLPSVDIFSFTQAGTPWILHEWLSQLVFYGIYSFFGMPGIRILTGLVFTFAFYLVNRLAYRLNTNLLRSTFITGVLLIISIGSCSVRPQLFSFLFLAIYVYVLFDVMYLDNRKKLLLLPVIMIVWANMHGGYLIGLTLIGVVWSTRLLQALFSKSRLSSLPAYYKALSVTLVTTVLASLITPYSYELWLYPFNVMEMGVAMEMISEWRSPDFHTLFNQAFLVVIMLFCASMIYTKRKPDITELALAASFIFMGFYSRRHIPLTAIVIIPLFAMFARYFDLSSHKERLSDKAPVLKRYPDKSGNHLPHRPVQATSQSTIAGWLLLVLCVATAFVTYTYHTNKGPHEKSNLPAGAVQFIKNNNIHGNLFNNYNHGGYLIYELFPQQKVFIDGRADVYGDKFISEYLNIHYGGENWKELLDKYAIEYALVDKYDAINQLLNLSDEFKVIYEDDKQVLYSRSTVK